jgi:hypothetical protein
MSFRYLFTFALCTLLVSCSQKIVPDRATLFSDAEPSPTVDLSYYKSVQARAGQNPDIAAAMCVSGGGHRAANFAVGVMLGLEELVLEQGRDVLDEIDYLSTVSGGGFAGGAYLRSRLQHQWQGFAPEDFRFSDYVDSHIREDLSHSYTGTLLLANFNPRLWFTRLDDGDALEKKISDLVCGYNWQEEHSDRPKSIRLGDIFVPRAGNRQVRHPMLITNSSEYLTMRIFPFTPDILKRYRVNGYVHRMHIHRKDTLDPFQVPLSTGIKASGSFPVLISNSTFYSDFHPKRSFLHLVDGAMTDNQGFTTAFEVLKQEQTPKKILLLVDSDSGAFRPVFSGDEGAISSVSVYGRLSYSGIDAMRLLVYRQLEELPEFYNIEPIILNFATLLKDNPAPPPKPFYLKKQQKRMVKKLKEGLDKLTDADRQMLYELVTRIATKYTIKEMEQEILLQAGRLVVHLQKEEILAAFKG